MENIDNIISKIKNNSNEENKKLAEELKNNLSESQNAAIDKLLSNKELMQKLMNTPEAQNLMNKLGGENNGHR